MLNIKVPLLGYVFLASLLLFLLQACSGNSFHLRKNVDLPVRYQKIQIQNISYDSNFVKVFEEKLEDSGGVLVSGSNVPFTNIVIDNFREGKRVVAYTSDRKAREYLLSLKFDYKILMTKKTRFTNKSYRINLDRVLIYDADFALGKVEEENKIKQNLYEEAARLIILKLQYEKK